MARRLRRLFSSNGEEKVREGEGRSIRGATEGEEEEVITALVQVMHQWAKEGEKREDECLAILL